MHQRGARSLECRIEDLRPLLGSAVRCENDRAALVALRDDLEQEVGALLVYGQIPELVDDQEGRLREEAELLEEGRVGLRGLELVDDLHRRSEEDVVALPARGDAERDREVRLAEPGRTSDTMLTF